MLFSRPLVAHILSGPARRLGVYLACIFECDKLVPQRPPALRNMEAEAEIRPARVGFGPV